MKKTRFVAFPTLLVLMLLTNLMHAASTAESKTPSDYVLAVKVDRPEAVYHQGETVTFQIQLEQNKQPAASGEIDWKLSKDGVAPVQTGKVSVQAGKASITGKLDEPGFLLCNVTFNDGKNKLTTSAAAGIDPAAIQPSLPVPDDFDTFWSEKKKQLAAISLKPKLTPVPAPPNLPGIETFDLQVDCVGKPVSGYYSRPIGAAPKSAPALLYLDGAGVRSSDLLAGSRWAQKGLLALAINAHGIPNGQPREFYAALDTGDLKNYRKEGSASRETYYFLGMYLRVLRAIDFLAAQPEWDGRTLIIEGVSQGAAQAITGAALDSRVTFLVAAMPAMSDHTGMVVGRVAGWPKLVPVDAAGKPDPAVLETSRYFDTVNFASRVKARTWLCIGFIDIVTPPTGSYAAGNQIHAEKEIVNAPENGHGHDDPKFWPDVAKLILDYVEKQKSGAK